MVSSMVERWSLRWLRNGLLDGCKMLFAQRLEEILPFLVTYQNHNFLCSGHQICSLFYGLQITFTTIKPDNLLAHSHLKGWSLVVKLS
jgi:hypothetical protein